MIHSALNRFLKDEHGGAVTAFILVIFTTMLVGGGMGVDFMRHESERAALQDALDRGVLAATSFDLEDKGMDLDALVTSYIRTNTLLHQRNPDLNVTKEIALNSRRITITGTYEINTFFLKLVGIPTLSVEARSTARTSRGEVEISLILDNSGSMYGRKMQNLKDAANVFIDLMLNENTFDRTTISLVPFTAQVNAGSVIASNYNLDTWHNYSWCFAFGSGQYDTTALSRTREFTQEQHYYRNSYQMHECPNATILPFSNSPEDLHTAINDMEAGGYTATYAGMKWGTALLDPAAAPLLTSLVAGGEVAPVFAGRPGAWDKEDGAKFIILMTDGANTTHKEIRHGRYERTGADTWDSQSNADYWDGRRCNSDSNCRTRNLVSGSEGDIRLQAICDAAKQNIHGQNRDRIIVFTIGFNVSEGSNPYRMMRDCASSASKFYHVEDADLTTVFSQIATSIVKLRLTD